MFSRKLLQGCLFCLVTMVFSLNVHCYAQESADFDGLEICNVETAGNVSLTRAKILSEVRSRVGEAFSSANATEDARRIGGLGGIEYAYYNTEPIDGKVKLTFVVIEKKLVRSISFDGNEHFKDKKLTKELGFNRGDYLDMFLVRNSVEVLTELYQEKGYAFVEITLDEENIGSGNLIYQVNEFSRVKIEDVIFRGNDSIETKELKKALKTRKKKFLFLKSYYVPQKVLDDVTKLEKVFQAKGHLDVSVKAISRFNDDKSAACVEFEIAEGGVYTVEEIVLAGNTFFESGAICECLKLKVGQYYSAAMAQSDAGEIARLYQEQGFIDVSVASKRSFKGDNKVLVDFEIVEGGRFRIGRIVITGNETTQDKVIRRVLNEDDFTPGEWYNGDIARGNGQGELETDIRQTVMAESAFIQSIGEYPDRRDAHISIVEGQTGSIIVGAGLASDSGMVGQLSFDQRNFDIMAWPDQWGDLFNGQSFRGAGQRLRASIEPGTEQTTFSVSFTEPYLYDKPVSLDVVASGFERDRESYNEKRLKGYFGFEKRYENKWRRGIAFRSENVTVSDIDIDAPVEIKSIKGKNNVFGAKFYIRKDTTDNRFLPTSGYNFNMGYEQVGGDFNFGVVNGTQRWYCTLSEDLAGRKTVLETKFHGAAILGDAPAFEKFYGGGTGSIRGFDYRGVSTRGVATVGDPVKDDPIGSDWILLANTEIAVPLTSESISALFFADAGAIDTGGVRASVGFGIQIMIPQWFGPVPMRFELASPLLKDDLDDTRAFSFTVGSLF